MADSLPLITSAVEGSEDVLDIFCDPCYQIDDKFSEPAGYCIDCGEHLCKTCYSLHKRTKPTRNHHLEDGQNMSRSKSQGQSQVNTADVICHFHKAERVLYFCQSHDQLCCQLCVSITHRRCSTELISRMATKTENSTECQNDKIADKFQ